VSAIPAISYTVGRFCLIQNFGSSVSISLINDSIKSFFPRVHIQCGGTAASHTHLTESTLLSISVSITLSTSFPLMKGVVVNNKTIISGNQPCFFNSKIACFVGGNCDTLSSANSFGLLNGTSAPHSLAICAISSSSVETTTLSTYLLSFPALIA